MAAVTAFADIVEQVLDVYTKIPYAHGELTCEARKVKKLERWSR